MPEDTITGKVEAIEATAEKLIKEARVQAAAILRAANDEAISISSAKISLDEVKQEAGLIIEQARQAAAKEGGDSAKKAEEIRASTRGKGAEIASRIIYIISGAD